MAEFNCDSCGLCCRNLHYHLDYLSALHTGDGVCIKANEEVCDELKKIFIKEIE